MSNNRPDPNAPPGTPRWVKALGIIFIVLVLVVGFMLLSGEHGPGRHNPSGGNTGGQTPSATEHEGHQP